MTAPADSLAELISAACEMSRAPSPEAHAMALTLFAMKAGAALGCSPDEVKEQLELMRDVPQPMRMGTVSRGRGHSITEAVESLAPKLRLVRTDDAHH